MREITQGKDPNYSSDEFGEEEEGSFHHNENAASPVKKRTKVLDDETVATHMSVEPGVSRGSTCMGETEVPLDRPGTSTSPRHAPYETTDVCLYGSGPNSREFPQEFLWEAYFVTGIDVEELIKAATARSLEVQSKSKEETDLETLAQKYQVEQAKPETCTIIVLRKKIMQTCAMAIQKETFDFAKVPCIVFSGEDAADLGGASREFFKLLMRGVCQVLGVFEGSSNNLVFSHDHSVISSRKPYLADQLLSWCILHGGPGLHSLSEDVYYLMMDMHDDVDAERAALAIADDGAAEVARALMAVDGDWENSRTNIWNGCLTRASHLGSRRINFPKNYRCFKLSNRHFFTGKHICCSCKKCLCMIMLKWYCDEILIFPTCI